MAESISTTGGEYSSSFSSSSEREVVVDSLPTESILSVGDQESGEHSIWDENEAPALACLPPLEHMLATPPNRRHLDTPTSAPLMKTESIIEHMPASDQKPEKSNKKRGPQCFIFESQPSASVGNYDVSPMKEPTFLSRGASTASTENYNLTPLAYPELLSERLPPRPTKKLRLKDEARSADRSNRTQSESAQGETVGSPALRQQPNQRRMKQSGSRLDSFSSPADGGPRLSEFEEISQSQVSRSQLLIEEKPPVICKPRCRGTPRLYREHVIHRPWTRSLSSVQKVYVPIDCFMDKTNVKCAWEGAAFTVGTLLEDFLCPLVGARMVRVQVNGLDDPQEFLHCVVDVLPAQPLIPKQDYTTGCVCCFPEGETDLPMLPESSDPDFTTDDDPIPATLAEQECEADKTWQHADCTEAEMLAVASEYFRYEKSLPFEQKFHDVHWIRDDRRDFGSSREWLGSEQDKSPRITKSMSPLDILELFVTAPMWVRMVRQTNLYARQKERKGWTQLTIVELKCWLGIAIFMGIKRLPRLAMHWKKDHAIFRNDFISSLMPRDRWLSIMGCLHLVDNRTIVTAKDDPTYDKIVKVRWLVDAVCSNFRACRSVDQYLSVDEMMIACTSRFCPIKQFNKDKPDPHGMKVWALVSASSRFIYALNVYCGAQSGPGQVGARRPPAKLPLEQRATYKVVMELMKFVPGEVGHVVTMDNFFSSVKLFSDLLEHRIFATGTVRPGAIGWPSSMLWSKKMKGSRGHLRWRMHASREMGACVWYDRKAVGVLSTYAQPWSACATVIRREGHKKVEVPTSPSVISYVQLMRGVDVADQLRGGYSISRKGRRWWKKVYFFIIDSAICNSWVLASELWKGTPHDIHPFPTHLDFNIALGDCLVAEWRKSTAHRKVLGDPNSKLTRRAHAPIWYPNCRRQCVQCGRRSNWRCEVCEGGPFLCLRGENHCYQVHHEKKRLYI